MASSVSRRYGRVLRVDHLADCRPPTKAAGDAALLVAFVNLLQDIYSDKHDKNCADDRKEGIGAHVC